VILHLLVPEKIRVCMRRIFSASGSSFTISVVTISIVLPRFFKASTIFGRSFSTRSGAM
jgi:hypothetical protein